MIRALVPIPRPAASPDLRRRSAIATLAAAGMLSADQIEAAWRLAALWHDLTAQRSAADLLLGSESRPASDRALAAKQRLQNIRGETGSYGFELLQRVAIEGFALGDLFEGRRARDTHADLLRVHLTEVRLLLSGHGVPPPRLP